MDYFLRQKKSIKKSFLRIRFFGIGLKISTDLHNHIKFYKFMSGRFLNYNALAKILDIWKVSRTNSF